jgi:hypothetical protein
MEGGQMDCTIDYDGKLPDFEAGVAKVAFNS